MYATESKSQTAQAVATSTRNATTEAGSASQALADSPRMVTQRQQIAEAFGNCHTPRNGEAVIQMQPKIRAKATCHSQMPDGEVNIKNAEGRNGKASNEPGELRRHPQISAILPNYHRGSFGLEGGQAPKMYACAEPHALKTLMTDVRSSTPNKGIPGTNAPYITNMTVTSDLMEASDSDLLSIRANYPEAQVGKPIDRCPTCVTLLGPGNGGVSTLPQANDDQVWGPQ